LPGAERRTKLSACHGQHRGPTASASFPLPASAFLFSSEADPDGEFDHVDTADAEQDFATYLTEIEAARRAAAGHDLDETFHHAHRKTDMSVRWAYIHMIEEYARHNGHADLLRERIDGATGM
jgi:hypothetical protein